MRPDRRRFVRPFPLESLEGRQLLAAAAADPAPTHPTHAEVARLDIAFRAVRLDIARMQLTSHVTRAEFRTAAVDFLACGSGPASKPSADPQAIKYAESTIEYDLSHAFIGAGYTAKAWASNEKEIGDSFAVLGHPAPPAALDRLSADLQAIAKSAGVTPAEDRQLLDDDHVVFNDMLAFNPHGATDFTEHTPAFVLHKDPVVYFERHVGRFVPGLRPGEDIKVSISR